MTQKFMGAKTTKKIFPRKNKKKLVNRLSWKETQCWYKFNCGLFSLVPKSTKKPLKI